MGIWELVTSASVMAQTRTTRQQSDFGHSAGDIEWGLEPFKRQLLAGRTYRFFDRGRASPALRPECLMVEFRNSLADGSVTGSTIAGEWRLRPNGQSEERCRV